MAAEDTLSASYTFRGQDKAMDAMLNLLVCLQASGARLKKIGAKDGKNMFLMSGTLSFEVTGTLDEVAKFRRAFTTD